MAVIHDIFNKNLLVLFSDKTIYLKLFLVCMFVSVYSLKEATPKFSKTQDF